LKVDTSYCERCAEEYGNPCEKFCPASVYVVERDETTGKFQKLRIDFSNCVHCKTCDIKDPYGAINGSPQKVAAGRCTESVGLTLRQPAQPAWNSARAQRVLRRRKNNIRKGLGSENDDAVLFTS